jgi:hypothetical protein
MARRNWKQASPCSLRQAMEWSLEHARVRKNLSVDRVADGMGLASKWTLYKWLENGRLPAVLIRPFESTCGIDLVTRYLCHSNHKLIVAIPKGRQVKRTDLHELQATFATAVSLLVEFYDGSPNPDETLGALTKLMQDTAWHRMNVEKHFQPALDLPLTGESHE